MKDNEPYVAQCHSNGYGRTLNKGYSVSPEKVEQRRAQLREKPLVVDTPPESVEVVSTAPIPMAVLRRKFTEKVKFIIDYDNSKHRGKVLLTYLSNLDTEVDIQSNDVEALKELLLAYLQVPVLVGVELLEDLAMNLLLAYARKPFTLPFDPTSFLAEHDLIVSQWYRRCLSLNLYALWCTGKHKEFVESHARDDNDSVEGLNYVALIKHRLFIVLMSHHDPKLLTWNKKLFDEYMYAGSNLFSFFAVKDNPLFAMVLAAENPVDHDEFVLQLKDTLDKARVLAGI